MNNNKYYKISELSNIASVPVPTIRFYLKEGLLPPAIRVSQTSAYYTDEHLNILLFIKKKQNDEKKQLNEIKDELDKLPKNNDKLPDGVIGSSKNRDKIIATAIDLFIKKGVGETTVDEIVSAARIGKGTFYKYFTDKNELFVTCADSVFYNMYLHIWEEIRREKDIYKRLFKRFEEFINSYEQWIDMMSLLRYNSVGDNQVFKEKYHSVLNQIIKPIAKELSILKEKGQINHNIDTTGLAYILMGATEYGVSLIKTKKYSVEDISSTLENLIIKGISKK